MSDTPAYETFRSLCNAILEELERRDKAQAVAAIGELLERLYDCGHGDDDALKRVIVAVQSQVNRVAWDEAHTRFLFDLFSFLRWRRRLDGETVARCYETLKQHGLDPFRGSVAQPV